MGKLDGKVAVITGATSGLALASAQLFVKEGAYVFITGGAKTSSTRRLHWSARTSRVFRAMRQILPTWIACLKP